MLIEERLPIVVGEKAPMWRVFALEGLKLGTPIVDLSSLHLRLPSGLRDAPCFYDKATNLWRYEFGLPYEIRDHLVFGPQVWQPVENLVRVVSCAAQRLDESQFSQYMLKLANRSKHEDFLAEFLPALRLPPNVHSTFEFSTGAGGHNVDWRFSAPDVPPILLDVKRRVVDIVKLMGRTIAGERRPNGHAPQPNHNVELLFKSIECKYAAAEPEAQLQGAWIFTALQQETVSLERAFDALDATKVHFAVLGGWKKGVKILARREADRALLLGLFDEEESANFEFTAGR